MNNKGKYLVGYNGPNGFIILWEGENRAMAFALAKRYRAKHSEPIIIKRRVTY